MEQCGGHIDVDGRSHAAVMASKASLQEREGGRKIEIDDR